MSTMYCYGCALETGHTCPTCGATWHIVVPEDEYTHDATPAMPCTKCEFAADARSVSRHSVQVFAQFGVGIGWSYTMRSNFGAFAMGMSERAAVELLEPYCRQWGIPVAHPREILKAAHITTPEPIQFIVGTC